MNSIEKNLVHLINAFDLNLSKQEQEVLSQYVDIYKKKQDLEIKCKISKEKLRILSAIADGAVSGLII